MTALLLLDLQREEICESKNLHAFILAQRQQLAVACDDEVRLCFYGTFENAVIGLVPHDVEPGAVCHNSGDMADGLDQCPGFVFRPVEFVLEDCCRFGEDGNRDKEVESATDGSEVGFFCVAPRNSEG